jgi:hypothetical protein
VTSQTRRIEITAPQRTKAWLCAGVHEPGHYVDDRRATILLGGEGSDGSTTTAQASLTIADALGLLAALEWMLAGLRHQASLATAEEVPWAHKQHPPKMARIAKCGKCERPIAFAQDAELELAGWQHPNTFARWVCPACKVDNG